MPFATTRCWANVIFTWGDLGAALESYNSALRVFLANKDWLKRLEYPPNLQPRNPRPVTWQPKSRGTLPGNFGATVMSRQTGINAQALARQGLIMQQQELYPIRAYEVFRCTALALARRLELLGPATQHDSLSSQIERALAARTVVPTHWARKLLDVQLAMAKANLGDIDGAYSLLQQSLSVGRLDHPLTGFALLQVGKIALQRNETSNRGSKFL